MPRWPFAWICGATAFVALGIGLTRLLPFRLKKLSNGRRWIAWVVPLVAWGWMEFDHTVFSVAADGDLPALLNILYTLDERGILSSIVFYALILGSSGYEWWLQRRGRDQINPIQLSVGRLKLLQRELKTSRESLLHLVALQTYLQREGPPYSFHSLLVVLRAMYDLIDRLRD